MFLHLTCTQLRDGRKVLAHGRYQKVKIKSCSIIYFAISPDDKVCWANVRMNNAIKNRQKKLNKTCCLGQ